VGAAGRAAGVAPSLAPDVVVEVGGRPRADGPAVTGARRCAHRQRANGPSLAGCPWLREQHQPVISPASALPERRSAERRCLPRHV